MVVVCFCVWIRIPAAVGVFEGSGLAPPWFGPYPARTCYLLHLFALSVLLLDFLKPQDEAMGWYSSD